MLIYDVLHKEKVYQIVLTNLRTLGVKHHIKKNAVKTDRPDRSTSNLKKVFKIPLSYLPLDVVNLSSGAIIHVPLFVSQATIFLLKHVNHEGLFRKAGSQLRQKEIISRLDSGGNLGEKNNAIDVANCLKTFLRNLPEPLIPYIYHDLFVRCNLLKTTKINALLLACILLPPHHLNTLAYLMEFLKTVASYNKQNKMGIDNLARVIGPNIMPLQETTSMLAVQSRLDAHLNIVKLLIENAEKIGTLPVNIVEAISMDTIGSIENELDHSSSFKNKKKKHRSGSLTRMLSGLKKMVGKNNSPNDSEISECNLLAVESASYLHTPSLRTGKKRKIIDASDSSSIKRHPSKDKSPNQKIGVSRYLSNKIHSETEVCDKIERTKKLRLSLDRFVPRHKFKIQEQNIEVRKQSFSPYMERRWNSNSNSSETKKRQRTKSIDSPFTSSPQAKIYNSSNSKTLNEIFMDADINLSDNSSEQISEDKFICEIDEKCKHVNSSRKSTHSYSLRNSLSPTFSNIHATEDNKLEEYVKIPKSEYEEIKNRVSAIESRISQEFKSINSEPNNILTSNPIVIVQNEYEKTLVEASIENTASTDQLAKRLSKELKIRRSAEHKIIRSPSARKIGNIRRRSQEKPISKKVHRTSSLNMTERPNMRSSILNSNHRLNNHNYPKQCNLKRGRPLVNRDAYKSLEQTPKNETIGNATYCSTETNARLEYLQEQLNTLINHTAEHTQDCFNDENFASLEDVLFKNTESQSLSNRNILNPVTVRRASSFHSSEFIDNSKYFNQKIKELKKTNSQQILTPNATKCPESNSKKEKTVTWKDADVYFQQESKLLTPVPQTGRASVAKLRTQNAGMVLAKAKLFDDPTKEAIDVSRRQSMKVIANARVVAKDEPRTSHGSRRNNGETNDRRKHNNLKRKSPKNLSPLIKIDQSINSNGRRQSTRFAHSRLTYEESNGYKSQKESETVANNESNNLPIPSQKHENINVFKPSDSPICKTPHIKKPLNVKTPRSAKSLSARRSTMNSRRTPLKAVLPITPKRQSPRIVLKSMQLSRHLN